MTPSEIYRDDDEGLALLTRDLREERPEVDPDFAARLDRWAADGFPRAARPGDRRRQARGRPGAFERLRNRLADTPPRRMLAPVGAVATLLVVVGVAISQSGGPQSGGGGGAAQTLDAPEGGGEATSSAEPSVAEDNLDLLEKAAPPETSVQGLDRTDTRYNAGGSAATAPDERKVARTADLILATEPEEVREVADGVNEVVNRYRGIVVSSSVQSGDGDGVGLGSSFQLRIPASNLQPALADLSELAHVQSRTESTEDITGKFISAQERIDELEAERESVLNQLADADTEEEADALRRQLRSLNSQLSGVRAELEDARQRVQLVPVSVSIVSEEGAGDDGDWGIEEAIEDAGDLLSTAAGVVVVVGAVLLPIAIIALLVALVLRTRTGRARERALDE